MKIIHFQKAHRPLHTMACALFFFLFFFFNLNLNAQKTYVRVSINDCVNCYLGFFEPILSHPNIGQFKYLFPENFKGKRFEQFNSIHFHDKVSKDQVVFSDSLYRQTKNMLHGLSGIVLMYHGNILLAETAEEFVKSAVNVPDFLDKCTKTKVVLDLQKIGISRNATFNLNFEKDQLILNDDSFRKLYLVQSPEISQMDLSNDSYKKLIEKFTDKKTYSLNKEYIPIIHTQIYPTYPKFTQSKNGFYMGYGLPFIKSVENQNSVKDENIIISNLRFVSAFDFDELKTTTLDTKKIIDNSFKVEWSKSGFETTEKFAVYNGRLYCLNYFYPKEQKNKPQLAKEKPMFSIFEKDTKDSVYKFVGYSKLRGMEFQNPTETSYGYPLEIDFLSTGSNILLKLRPYAINVARQKVYKLDWDPNINQLSEIDIPINYYHMQLWENDGLFYVLVYQNKKYRLKVYDENWNLKREESLPFYPKNIPKFGVTKNSIYFWADDHLLRMPNFITGI